jgi:hypothetical protein
MEGGCMGFMKNFGVSLMGWVSPMTGKCGTWKNFAVFLLRGGSLMGRDVAVRKIAGSLTRRVSDEGRVSLIKSFL